MTPPEELKLLTMYKDGPIKNNFLNNTLPINSASAFGSMTCGKVYSVYFNNLIFF